MTDKIPGYVRSVGNCENIKQKRHAVEVVKRLKRIGPKHIRQRN